ncbi:porin [Aliidiomarina halalkaliphila]|uniref:Porin n=1 Tax=Aliidiomarina halalkaliphila TaxID=2593535 RepID=A0A552X1J3_9GAMM|nr:OprO/OprP family phosphate-selective porin [Aliidiomarina halalkaliphila]TRW48897.1 porin [Aliidiomarina halalkaliphila]
MTTTLKISAVAALIALACASGVAEAKSVEVRGRMHLDTATYDSDVTELGNATALRRTRLGMSGKLDDTWSFQIEYDFAENGTSANDVYLRRPLGEGTLTIGQVKVPMGLNELTSSNAITFMERASNSNITADSRRIGIHYAQSIDNLLFQSMLYTRGIGGERPSGANSGSDAPMGIAGRLVFTPSVGENQLLHLGVSVAAEDRGDFNALRYRDRPEVRPADIRLIDTGTIADVDSTLKFGLEAAYQSGPFSIEAEYLANNVNRDGNPDVTFDGFHIQTSYVLTGEKRGYRGGNFRGISPNGKGAWEVAARYSQTNLSDGLIVGGEQSNITLGLNYYASSNVRFMANVIFADIKDGINGDEKPTAFALRAQFAF